MHRQALKTGSSRLLTPWLYVFALGAIACGTSDVLPTAHGGSGGAGHSDHTAGSGGVTGGAGKTAGSGGLAASAGKTAGRGGSAGAAAGSGEDAGAPPCAPCIEGSVSWGNIGGLVAFTERSTLDTCNVYQHTRSPSGRGGSTMLACQRSLPCMGSGLHGVSDVLLAIQNADVQAALAKGHVLFGNDSRPVDGTVFEIVARDSTAIEVGSACSGGASCSAIPAAVSALADLLRAIDDEQLNLDPCRSMFRP